MRRPAAVTFVVLLAAAGATADPADSVFPPGWRQGWTRSVGGPKLSYHWDYPGYAVSLLCRAVDPTWAIEWEGEPAPAAAPDETVTYVWHVGLDSGTTPHRFELRLYGRPVASFDTSGGPANRAWTVEGRDGARLHLLTTRIGSFDERFGFMALSLPRRLLGATARRGSASSPRRPAARTTCSSSSSPSPSGRRWPRSTRCSGAGGGCSPRT